VEDDIIECHLDKKTLQTYFKIYFFVFHRRNKVIYVWIDMRMRK